MGMGEYRIVYKDKGGTIKVYSLSEDEVRMLLQAIKGIRRVTIKEKGGDEIVIERVEEEKREEEGEYWGE